MHNRFIFGLVLSIAFVFASAPPAFANEPFSAVDEQGRAVYLIEFAEPGLLERHQQRSTGRKFSIDDATTQALQAELMSTQANHLRTMETAFGRSLAPSHYYLVSHSGMAMRLTSEEVRELASMPHVASIKRERVYQLDTYRGPAFIGAPSIWDGSAVPGGTAYNGQGMVAAILDSGIPDPATHDSFGNQAACGHNAGNPKVRSTLDCSSTDGTGLCNGPDPVDSNGHGSHTASTVAGNAIDETASPNPTIPGGFTDMSGVAPCATIRNYRVCPGSSCPAAAIQGGMDSVLIHGDVTSMNFSISGGTSPWNDNDRRKLDLVDAGVFVAASAGNTRANNPTPEGDVNHLGPWVMSVAASTRDTNNGGGSAQGDVLAGFSLRGPSAPIVRDLQKPNITAPGVNIYAAVPGGFAFLSGTSMSGPHVAGAGLLVAQANPDWTPMEVKSAMEMSSFNGGFKENGTTPWDPDDVGSGRVDLTQAALSGLVMNETTANFLAANPADNGDVRTLNLPSVRDLDCTPSCSFTRTVRNTLSTASNWTVAGSAFNNDFSVQVTPSTFSFSGDIAETQELVITLLPTDDTTDTIAFGEIVFTEDNAQSPVLRFTAAMSGEGGPDIVIAPASMSFTVPSGLMDSAPLTISNTGTLDLDWSISESTPDSGNERGVLLEETLTIGGFTVNPNDVPVLVDVEGGLVNNGNVVGLRFDGEVTVIGDGDWASDMRMIVTAPEGPVFSVGGLTGNSNDWAFQGGGSTDAGIYSSSHPNAFDPFTGDAGTWGFSFEHNWDSADASDMTWAGVEVTLLKEAIICENAANIPWLSVDTTSGTTAAGADSVVQVQVDTFGLDAGTYEAQVCVSSNATSAAIVAVPVTLEVTGTPDPAMLEGTVTALGYCQADPSNFAGIEVAATGQNNTQTVVTDANGAYQMMVEIAEGPVNVSIDHPGYLPASVSGVALTPGQTSTNDMDLILAETCAEVSDAPIAVVVELDGSASMNLEIGNSNGGAPLDWNIFVADIAASCKVRGAPASAWLSTNPASGTAGIGGSSTISVDFDASQSGTGMNTGVLCVSTNDSNEPLVVIPVEMDERAVLDDVYDDRFEAIGPLR